MRGAVRLTMIGAGVIEVGGRSVIMEGTAYLGVELSWIALSVLVPGVVSVPVSCAVSSVVAMTAVRCV